MPDRVPASGVVHWIGTGLSTGGGLREVAAQASVVLWGRTEAKAAACADRLGLAGRVATRAWADLDGAVGPGDVVVSMLPATEHERLLRLCLDRGAHFADTSYVSPPVAELAGIAGQRGLVVLTEAGLDPGLDHLLAHDLVARATDAIGDEPATAVFTSYCGGVPAVPNEFRYRFSWAPRGVLTALLSTARYLEDGRERTVERPWEATRGHDVAGETFEAYPNRDSLPFIEQYRMPASWALDTFVRGTLRLEGWRQAWEPVFAELVKGDQDAITALAADLAARYPTTDADRDRVVLSVALTLRTAKRTWSARYLVDDTGDDTDSAMARLVSTPLAAGIADILADRSAPGLHRAAEAVDDVRRHLAYLADRGIRPVLTEF